MGSSDNGKLLNKISLSYIPPSNLGLPSFLHRPEKNITQADFGIAHM